MKKVKIFTTFLFAAACANADLVITEVMSDSDASSGSINGDWFEITNTGSSGIELANYYWDDNGPSGNDGALFPEVTIGAEESLIILDESVANLPAWRTAWSISDNVQVISKDEFGGPDDFSGLSSSGDAIQIWDADPNAGPANEVATVTFGAATAGISFEWAINGTALALSVSGENEAKENSAADVGSPGSAVDILGPFPPSINPPLVEYGRVYLDIAYDDGFDISALDPNFGDTISFTTNNAPDWLTTTDNGDGTLSLSGTPTLAGVYSFEVTATDDSPAPLSTTETVTLHIASNNNPVLLNEYNAVDSGNFLNSGDATQDQDGGTAADSFFQRIEGNGGDWFELVVVGYGDDADNDPSTAVVPQPGTSVDMRGWQIEIISDGGSETIVLSEDNYWATVPVGTLLTFIEDNSAGGGLDTEINKISDLTGAGYTWSNIWIHDPFFIDQELSDFGDGIVVDSGGTNFIIRDESNEPIFGPVGEGVNPESGIGSDEIFKLEQGPVPVIDPVFGNFQDGESSTFGSPNQWSGGNITQSFAAFQIANTPPQFDSAPNTEDDDNTVSTAGTYSYAVSVSDPDGTTPSLLADQLPSFLTLTGNTLSNNRPLTIDDAGIHNVELSASDGNLTTPQKFRLTVYNPAPAIILNEYNAVSGSSFLNGGDALADDSSGEAADAFFDRVAGNGGDWFELVVVGDGGPGHTDLRGYAIEVGRSASDGSFDKGSEIVLSSDAAWATVENGTILTFTEDNRANGGHDSDLKITDNLTSGGWIWTNIWLGDPTLLDYTDEATNGYDRSSLPEVSGLEIDEANTQIRILDASTRIVFGPAGEGIAPLSGVSATDVFELEGDPSPLITPLDDAQLAPAGEGYDDGASGSTFGAPNEWNTGEGGAQVSQDFSAFIAVATPFEQWTGSFGLSGAGAQPSADTDGDGFSNLEEYLFGGEPDNALERPSFSIDPLEVDRFSATARTDDSSYSVFPQWSRDLENWFSSDFTEIADAPSSEGPSYRDRTWELTLGDEPTLFYRLKAE